MTTYTKLSIIVAMDKNSLIGKENKLPWKLPADLKHFKELTINKTVIMGRKTYQSLEKPLEDRHNIVISHDKDFTADGRTVVHSLEEALLASEGEVFIIGGASIYKQAMPLVEYLYVTYLHSEYIPSEYLQGDTYFPHPLWYEFKLISLSDHYSMEKGLSDYSFAVFKRVPEISRLRP